MKDLTPDTAEEVLQNLVDGGGPAFPVRMTTLGAEFHGMTLRDYFAAQALASGQLKVEGLHDYELIAMFGKDRTGIRREEIAAAQSYLWADAMLERRSK